MITNSFGIEFGYELIAVVPWAYYLHTKGELTETISVKDMAPFYYFSPHHTEVDKRRHWDNMEIAKDIPNIRIHTPQLNTEKWTPPPFKEYYKNDTFKFDKPTLIVTNKYNIEWGGPPVNFIDLDTLQWIFENYQDKYQIIYSRFLPQMGYDDTVDTMDLGEFKVVREYPKVMTIQQLYNHANYTSKNITYNELQLKLYANCDKFITVQGGQPVLASYFGGVNIIFARKGQELGCFSYQNWYNLFGGSDIHIARSYPFLKETLRKLL